MRMKVAVTGAGGFIGKRLVVGLAQHGCDVYAVTSHPENIPTGPRITVVKCNWSIEGIEAALIEAQDAELWVHTAARVDFSGRNVLDLYRDNVLLTDHLLRGVAHFDVQARLIYLSSISVYGPNQEISLDVEPRPQTHYGLSKLLGERLCLAHLGERCLVYRLAGVWGRENSPKLFINRCLQLAESGQPLRVMGQGKARRNYLWVGDVPRLIIKGFEEDWCGIHLAAGPEAISIRDMVIAIGARFNVPVYFEKSIPATDEQDVIVPISPNICTTPFLQALRIEAERCNR